MWENVEVIGEVIGRESNWRVRKVHEAAELIKATDTVISAPSFDFYPV
jgi:hypothetical protein